MTYEEFRASLQKIHDARKHKITGSLGSYDAYKWIRKNKWLDIERPVTEKEFYAIIRSINNYLAEELLKGNDIVFPNKLGKLELRKHRPFIGFKKDKLIVNLAIDWDSTLKLWYEDEEAYNNHTLVKYPEKEIFKFYYNKQEANFTNKSFFEFSVTRDIKKAIKQQIKAGHIDAFMSYG